MEAQQRPLTNESREKLRPVLRAIFENYETELAIDLVLKLVDITYPHGRSSACEPGALGTPPDTRSGEISVPDTPSGAGRERVIENEGFYTAQEAATVLNIKAASFLIYANRNPGMFPYKLDGTRKLFKGRGILDYQRRRRAMRRTDPLALEENASRARSDDDPSSGSEDDGMPDDDENGTDGSPLNSYE